MLITKDFFINDIYIANLHEDCKDLSIFEFVERAEEECLRMVLGDCFYYNLVDQLEFNETAQQYQLKAGVDAKWQQLLFGHQYEETDVQNTSSYNCFNFLVLDYCGCSSDNCTRFYWDGIIKEYDKRIPETTINGQVANGIRFKTSFVADYIYWKWSLNNDSLTTGTGEQVADVKNMNRVSNTVKRVAAFKSFVSKVQDCTAKDKVSLYRYVHDFNTNFAEWQGKCLKYEPVW